MMKGIQIRQKYYLQREQPRAPTFLHMILLHLNMFSNISCAFKTILQLFPGNLEIHFCIVDTEISSMRLPMRNIK